MIDQLIIWFSVVFGSVAPVSPGSSRHCYVVMHYLWCKISLTSPSIIVGRDGDKMSCIVYTLFFCFFFCIRLLLSSDNCYTKHDAFLSNCNQARRRISILTFQLLEILFYDCMIDAEWNENDGSQIFIAWFPIQCK